MEQLRNKRDITETPHLIELKVSSRKMKGRSTEHFRIHHVPMVSLTSWPRGNYEILKDVDPKSGAVCFYIQLRPDTF